VQAKETKKEERSNGDANVWRRRKVSSLRKTERKGRTVVVGGRRLAREVEGSVGAGSLETGDVFTPFQGFEEACIDGRDQSTSKMRRKTNALSKLFSGFISSSNSSAPLLVVEVVFVLSDPPLCNLCRFCNLAA
jgi:hypothetical protein